MSGETSLWRTEGTERQFFLLPRSAVRARGNVKIHGSGGRSRFVSLASVQPFEISETQARLWAKAELGETLDQLKQGLDGSFAELRQRLETSQRTPISVSTVVTSDSGPALLDFLRTLPAVAGQSLSGDLARVKKARDAAGRVEQRLKDAGLDLEGNLVKLANRLASLRQDLNIAGDA
jgi:hypothetical protein